MTRLTLLALTTGIALTPGFVRPSDAPPKRQTVVSTVGEAFHINGKPTYPGHTWNGHKVEGLLMNSRMVQATFDDLNPATRPQWHYPDTQTWDADRNTAEFIAALPEYRRHGLLAVTLNFQGGSPYGYSRQAFLGQKAAPGALNAQPWHNSGFTATGELRPEYLARLKRVLEATDRLGMVLFLGYFYFGQDERLEDEQAVIRATDNLTDWVLDHGFTNVVVEVNNECDLNYDHEILKAGRVAELIRRVRSRTRGDRRLLAGTSFRGGAVPTEAVLAASDVAFVHGNGVGKPERLREIVRATRARAQSRPIPIVVNEDDHYDFDRPDNNLTAAVSEYASWGYFDYRRRGEPLAEGFQSVPVDWQLGSGRKRDFFALVARVTGAD